MKFSTLARVVVCLVMGLGGAAYGRDNEQRGHNNQQLRVSRDWPHADQRSRESRHDYRSGHRSGPRDNRFDQRDDRWNDRRDDYNARGPHFHHGGYIPDEFRGRQYHIADYHRHQLPPPPRDHRWVQVGADYVLIAIASGIIASIVLGQ